MKLQNKRTGEIGYLIVGKGSDHYVVANNDWGSCGKYDSLAELNKDWEDCEEPKEDGLDHIITLVEVYSNVDSERYPKEIVEKLKAWKRLKDKGIRFGGYDRNYGHWHINFTFDNYCTGEPQSASDDLDLLFGGEE